MSDDFDAQLDNLEEQIEQLHQEGRYKDAIDIAEQACNLTESHFGPDHPDHATQLNTLAELYMEIGRYDRAEELYREALIIDGNAFGKTDTRYASDLTDLAVLYQKMNRYLKAEGFFKFALQIDSDALGLDHPVCQRGLANLAGLYEEMRAYATRRSEEAEHYQAAGDYSSAEDIYDELSKIHEALRDADRRGLTSTEGPLGQSDSDSTDILLNNLGLMHAQKGNFVEAQRHFAEALAIKRSQGKEQTAGFAQTLNNLAGLHHETANSSEAEQLLQQAIEIYKKTLTDLDDPAYAECVGNLGAVYLGQAEYAKAEPLLKQALAIYARKLGKHHRLYANPLSNLAALHCRQENFSKAEPLYQQCIKIHRKASGEKHPSYATSIGNLAGMYTEMGRFADAEPLCRKALTIRRTALGAQHPLYRESLSDLADILVVTGRTAEALSLMNEAAAIDDLITEQLFPLNSKWEVSLYFHANIRQNLWSFLSIVTQYLSGSPDAVRAALDVVLRRKAIGAEAMFAQREKEVRRRSDTWDVLQRRLETPAENAGIWIDQSLTQQFSKTERTHRETKEKSQISLLQKLLSANRQAVARSLPERSALVEFVHYRVRTIGPSNSRYGEREPEHYVAFVMGADDPDTVRMFDLGDVIKINQLIRDYRFAITGEAEQIERKKQRTIPGVHENTASQSAGQQLAAAVLDPIREAISSYDRVVIAPDDNLARVPFETLPLDGDRKLIDDYCISYLTTGRDALRFGAPWVKHRNGPLVIADPDYDLTEQGQTDPSISSAPHSWFEHLPGTRAEGERLASLLGVKPWLNREALKGQVFYHRSPYVFHLATHGFYLPESDGTSDAPEEALLPERLREYIAENSLRRSGLALAGANTWLNGGTPPAEAEDGLLTAGDVYGMDFMGTQLAVLSACESGLGSVFTGEGIYGLSRAFFLSGVRTLVMSLWKVPDDQTRELMEEFYQRILGGETCAEALRSAQLQLKSRYANPFYWGAFICQGDPETRLDELVTN